ncbi:MAG: hypothetical protein R3D01_02410 [Hyphomicrobiales bacterium]
MRPLLIALLLLVISAPAAMAAESVGQAWEQSLLTHKRNGTLAGPRPGQKCLWSERLQGCLWYTPGRWNLYLRD